MPVLRLKIILAVTGIVAFVVLLSLVQEMNRRFQIQHEVRQLEQEAADMQRTITQLENLNQYFRTDDYQERLAREKLNYQAPGEKVVLLPDEAKSPTTQKKTEAPRPVPIVEKWWKIFFVPEKE